MTDLQLKCLRYLAKDPGWRSSGMVAHVLDVRSAVRTLTSLCRLGYLERSEPADVYRITEAGKAAVKET